MRRMGDSGRIRLRAGMRFCGRVWRKGWRSCPGDNQVTGGSFKIVADTADWDNSVGSNSPGQSGDVDSPHYRDLFALWARGDYFPVFYSRSKVESVAEKVLVLSPQPVR